MSSAIAESSGRLHAVDEGFKDVAGSRETEVSHQKHLSGRERRGVKMYDEKVKMA